MTLSSSNSFLNGEISKTETPNVKKRHRRVKSSGVKNSEYDGEFCHFYASLHSSPLLLNVFQMLKASNSTLFPSKANNGISTLPRWKNETNGWPLSSSKSSTLFSSTSRQRRRATPARRRRYRQSRTGYLVMGYAWIVTRQVSFSAYCFRSVFLI